MKEYKIKILQCIILLSLCFISSEECTNFFVVGDSSQDNNSGCPSGYYLLNCYCYNDGCPKNSELVIPTSSTSPRQCKCSYKYVPDNNGGYCLGKDEPCPDSWPLYIDGENICKVSTTGCSGTTPLKRTITTANGKINIQCVSQCNDKEVNSGNECLSTCLGTTNKFYYPEERICLGNCRNDDFAYPEKGTCHAFCETPLNRYDSTVTLLHKYECIEKNSCSETNNYHYLYSATNTCYKACSETLTDSKIGTSVKTYTYEDSGTNIKRCVTDCSLTSKPYVDKDETQCVLKCGIGEVIVKGICTTGNCKDNGGVYKYQIDGTNECLKSCPSDYFTETSTQICYKECKYNFYHDYINRICKAFTPGTDFIVLNDESRILYSKCPSSAPYYNSGGGYQNVCFSAEKGCSDANNPDQTYKYSYNNAPYKCLSDCTSTDLRTEDFLCLENSIVKCPPSYPYREIGKYTCYKNKCPKEDMDYSVDADKQKMCYTIGQSLTTCPGGEKYLQEGKCVTNCDFDHPYKIVYDGSTLGHCFKNSDGCFEKGFYYFSDGAVKTCSNTCTLKIQNDPNGKPYQREHGTCFTADCPSDFPYKNVEQTMCYKDKCPDNQYAPYDAATVSIQCKLCDQSTDYKYNKYCTTDCSNTPNKFTHVSDKICVEKCTNTEGSLLFYKSSDYKCLQNCAANEAYDPTTHECLSTCLYVKGYEFFPLLAGSSLPCAASCGDNQFYYDKDKKCLSGCNTDDHYSSSDHKRCVTSCEPYESVGTDNICTSGCPSFFYVNANKKSICVSKFDDCKGLSPTLIYFSFVTKQCFDKCPVLENYYYEGACYSKCPGEHPNYNLPKDQILYNECKDGCSGKFVIEGSYQCFDKCPDEKNYVEDDTNKCLKQCPTDHPYFLKRKPSGTENSYYSCVISCNSETESTYILDNKCVNQCNKENNGYKKYVDTKNECVSECPKDYPIFVKDSTKNFYVCQKEETCISNSKFIAPDKECVVDCPEYAHFIGKNNLCKEACDPVEDGSYYYKQTPVGSINYDIFKCSNTCEGEFLYRVFNTSQCLKNCPSDSYLEDSTKICYFICNVNKDYPFSSDDPAATTHKKTCSTSCLGSTNKYYLSDKKCISSCSISSLTNRTIDEFNACVVHCHYDENSENKYELNSECKKDCDNSYKYYSKKDYKCLEKCPQNEQFLTGKECRSSCSTSPKIFANEVSSYSEGTSNYRYDCKDKCDDGKKKYFKTDHICLKKCSEANGYNIYTTDYCVKTCGQDDGYTAYKYFYFFEADSTSFDQNTCVDDCASTDKPFTLENNTCSKSCNLLNKYYFESDKKCISQCPEPTHAVTKAGETNLNACVADCPGTTYLTDKGVCAEKCDESSKFEYYFEPEHICRQSCGEYYYKKGTKICLHSCPDDAPYLYEKTCYDQCPTDKKYFIYSFDQGEVNVQKNCLTDCPIEYPYVHKYTDSKDYYRCVGSCSVIDSQYKYFVSDPDPLTNAKMCLKECDQTNGYKFIGNNGECLKECPKDAQYHVKVLKDNGEDSGMIQCYQSCPDGYTYERNSYQCILYKECFKKKFYVDYDTKICVERCSVNQYWGDLGEIETNVRQLYCLNQCIDLFGLVITPDLQCVSTCSVSNDYIKDESGQKCLCKNLFYIDEGTGVKKCLDFNYNDCVDYVPGGDKPAYKYNVEGTKECVGVCKTISTGDFICLKPESKCPENSYLYHFADGSAQCKCKYKSYLNGKGQTICLGELANCPSGYKNIVVSTKECIKIECEAKDSNLKEFQHYCFSKDNCPKSFDSSSDSCKCQNNWYKKVENGDYQFICLDSIKNCVTDFPFMVKRKNSGGSYITPNECVSKCMNTDEDSNEYYILYGKTCVDNCPTGTTKAELLPNDSSYQYSHFTCYCNSLWYHDLSGADDNKIFCQAENAKPKNEHCIDFDKGLYYQIKETHECVKDCPSNYPFKFNDECLTNCEQGAIFGYDLQKKANTDFECECKNVWAWDTIDPKINVKKCFNTCKDSQTSSSPSGGTLRLLEDKTILEIKATKECIEQEKCPEDYPLRFNNECYAVNNCPSNSHSETDNAEKCICDNLWYYTDETNKIKYCMGKTDNSCPLSDDTKKYLIINENQCTSLKNCANLYVFNFYCYHNKCPDGTKAQGVVASTGFSYTNCTCDENFGYWYHEMKEADYLTCGRTDSCPEGKINIIEGTKECVHDCGQTSEYKVHFLNSCLKGNSNTACPGASYKIGLVEGVVECHYRTLDNSTSKAELAKFISEDLFLYYPNNTKTDYVYSKHNVNLQIYGINKNNMSDAELMKRADLSYIDLSKCIDKIYKSNNLSDDENVVIVKYDVLDTNKTYIINSVEYEFFSSKTYKKIDPSVCEAKSIVISYPVSYTVAKYDGTSNEEYNPYKKVFNLAKELVKENPEYDIYNSSSPIYKDPCITCKIDGKDLVLEDRVNYLYPSASTCENNCTFNNTDYEQERINCLCSPKETFDIDRNQPVINYNFSMDEIKDNQGGSSNLPVFNCLSRLDGKDKIAKNGGFYYMAVATVVEVALVIISGAVGYGRAIAKIGEGLQVNPGIENSANPPPKDGFNSDPANQQENRYIDSRSNMKDEPNQQTGQNNNRNQYGNNNRNVQQTGNDGLITIKKISPDKQRSVKNRGEKMAMYDEKDENEEKDSEADSTEKDISSAESLFKEIKNEQKMLRFQYQKAIRIDNNGALIMILAAIFDKIYLTKTLFFLRKYDIFSAYLSLYILFHVLLLTITAFFFDVKTIKKIWNEKNFPGIDWYLLIGFASNVIVWVIYKLFNCLLSNNDKIENLLILKYNVERREYLKSKKGISTEELLYQKYQKVIREIKIKMIIYYVICFALFIFSFIYLTVFCGIYTGTKKRVFTCYGISLIEILIIKIVYGIALGAMRKTSIESKIKCLYKVVRSCSIYLS